jgi:hypothetical protein
MPTQARSPGIADVVRAYLRSGSGAISVNGYHAWHHEIVIGGPPQFDDRGDTSSVRSAALSKYLGPDQFAFG